MPDIVEFAGVGSSVSTGEIEDLAVTAPKLANNIDATAKGFDAAKVDGVDIPAAIASVLTDHTKVVHTGLGLEDASKKDAANGYAGLDVSTLLALAQIPTPLTGKSADQVDGADAGIAAGDVFKILAAIAQGDILYVDGTPNIARLPVGTNGQFLKTQGAAANPTWDDVVAGAAINSGSYVGNDAIDRAIIHGLGVTPKFIFVYATSASNHWNCCLNALGIISRVDIITVFTVSVPDATDFHVGDAANLTNSANGVGITYDWVAIG